MTEPLPEPVEAELAQVVVDGQREEAILMLNNALVEYPGDENLESALKKVNVA